MKTATRIAAIGALVFGLTACNKTQSTSNRLIDGGMWNVTELTVNGVGEDELPMWEIDDCEIYDESCVGEWMNDEGGHAEFVWQFRDKGDTFEISYQAEEDGHGHVHELDHADEEVAAQAYGFSGIYEVTARDKDRMQFQSTAAIEHPGETVIITIAKQ